MTFGTWLEGQTALEDEVGALARAARAAAPIGLDHFESETELREFLRRRFTLDTNTAQALSLSGIRWRSWLRNRGGDQ